MALLQKYVNYLQNPQWLQLFDKPGALRLRCQSLEFDEDEWEEYELTSSLKTLSANCWEDKNEPQFFSQIFLLFSCLSTEIDTFTKKANDFQRYLKYFSTQQVNVFFNKMKKVGKTWVIA